MDNETIVTDRLRVKLFLPLFMCNTLLPRHLRRNFDFFHDHLLISGFKIDHH